MGVRIGGGGLVVQPLYHFVKMRMLVLQFFYILVLFPEGVFESIDSFSQAFYFAK